MSRRVGIFIGESVSYIHNTLNLIVPISELHCFVTFVTSSKNKLQAITLCMCTSVFLHLKNFESTSQFQTHFAVGP